MNETNIFYHKACNEQNILGENYTRSFFSLEIHLGTYIEDITRWREDINFMFEWQEQYLTSERSYS